MTRFIPLVLFILLVVGGGSLIGATNTPGEWYAALEKPPFNPPNWIFAPVWTTLYVMIAVAGWRIWRQARTGGAMTAWWLQMGLNFLWSPVFFTLQSVGLALAVIVALLAAIVAFIVLAWDRDRPAALLFLPYAAWVGFATLLNASIFWLN
ncbi:tryptophan-rich sensory protein [Mesorhizobium microcysteis]|uniref:Tryptophan-rich sensory protein n=1 Tax=Neoaquamicrobium microcysteis TaxID=2682781 RepID=A0A5D4GU98_9HYPH|nr:TspO/MBR family protein [Mesorhizobium microcysteis]TYR31938.1 tryptophan-rich sensory protein [Mesorhizobium microcysteis]